MSSSRQLLIAGAAALALVGCQKDATPESKAAATNAASPTAETVAQPTAARVAEAAAPTHAATADEGYSCGGKAEQEKLGCAGMGEEEGGGCNQWDDEASAVTKRAVPNDAVWTSYSVDGMTCGGCERRIIANVGRLDGVVAVEASAELGRVRVALAPGAKTTPDQAKARIAELGYRIQ